MQKSERPSSKYPGIGIHDEFGNWVFAFDYDKIFWWLTNYPNDPACKEYVRLYPDFIKAYTLNTEKN